VLQNLFNAWTGNCSFIDVEICLSMDTNGPDCDCQWRASGSDVWKAHERITGSSDLDFVRPDTSKQAITVGLIWLGLTVAFEFLFGHYVVGHPWSKLLYDYNVFAGRVWVAVLIWVTVAPYVLYRLQK